MLINSIKTLVFSIDAEMLSRETIAVKIDDCVCHIKFSYDYSWDGESYTGGADLESVMYVDMESDCELSNAAREILQRYTRAISNDYLEYSQGYSNAFTSDISWVDGPELCRHCENTGIVKYDSFNEPVECTKCLDRR